MPNWRKDYQRYRTIFSRFIDFYTKREDVKIFLELLLTLTTIIVFSIFALKPTVVTIIGLYKEIKAKEETLSKMDVKIKSLVDAQNTISSQQANIDLLEIAIPKYPYPEKAALQFIALAKNSSVDLNGISVNEFFLKGKEQKKSTDKSKEDLPENAASIEISIGLGSDFQKLMDMLSTIEKMRRPLKIDAIKMSKKTDKDLNQAVLEMFIDGRLPLIQSSEKQL